jgi:hypothetical protein
MTTVIAVYNLRGCIGRCDANCHDAKGDACTCICGGLNHGFGFERAQANAAKEIGLKREDLLAFAEATKRNPKELVVINRLKIPDAMAARRQAHTRLTQLDLFDREETII